MNLIAVVIMGAIAGMLRLPLETLGTCGTLAVNLTGSLALGIVTELFAKRPSPAWLNAGMCVGFIGSFTTFSGFANDAQQLASTAPCLALLYMASTLTGGILLASTGMRVTRRLLQTQAQKNQHNASAEHSIPSPTLPYGQLDEPGDTQRQETEYAGGHRHTGDMQLEKS